MLYELLRPSEKVFAFHNFVIGAYFKLEGSLEMSSRLA